MAAGAMALGGCSGGVSVVEPLSGPPGERLTAADFRGANGAAVGLGSPAWGVAAPPFEPAVTPAGAPVPANPTAAANQPATEGSAPGGATQVEATVGGPDLSGASPSAVESAALLDVKIGDINGRPIFASEFFEDMEERLIAESRLKPRRQWLEDTSDRISEKLGNIIAGELLRAEALESLPQEQREAGLGRVMARERAAIQSRAGGSLTQAQRELMEREGITLEEYLTQFQDRSLVNLSLQQMRQSVQVSGRDIRNYYERNYDDFNPKPSARFREIVVLSANAQAQAAVSAALASGTPFEEVAAGPLNTSTFRAQGGQRVVEFDGEYGQANLLNNEALNRAAWGLEPGEWTGPVSYGQGGVLTAWIYLERLTTSGRSLYEAQIEIAADLRDRETMQKFRETIERLSERASFTSEQQMVQRLLAIAMERYYPPGQPEPTAAPGFRP